MNENEKEVVNEEDFILMDENDFKETSEETQEVTETQASEEVTSKEENEIVTDEQKLLDYLNAKEIKYNGEAVKLESLDKFIDTFQKGMNYDNLKAKQEKSENVVMNYISGMAKKMNLTPEQYIEKVKEYEEKQKEQAQEEEVQKMVSRGVDEATARRVARTEAYMETLKAREEELNKQEEARKAEAQKDKEYKEFLEAYPGIEVDKIPKEVFENAKTSNLISAYAQYENKILKEQIKRMELNNKNASTSPVTAISDESPTEQATKDAFLEGFDSV